MGRTPSARAGARTSDFEGSLAPVDQPLRTPAGDGLRGHARPVRTCIGCRERADPSDLVRLVARGEGTAQAVVPDPDRSAPGRGAHLHPMSRCLDLAVRRRAFARALRQPGPLDTAAVRDWVEQHERHRQHSAAPRPLAPTGAGSHAETEHQLMSPR